MFRFLPSLVGSCVHGLAGQLSLIFATATLALMKWDWYGDVCRWPFNPQLLIHVDPDHPQGHNAFVLVADGADLKFDSS